MHGILWDTVNKRAVRILLECFFVTLCKEKLVAIDFVVSGVMTDGPEPAFHTCVFGTICTTVKLGARNERL